jgi:hypothetical protein
LGDIIARGFDFMKTLNINKLALVMAGVMGLLPLAMNVSAADTAPPVVTQQAPAPALAYGVPEIIQLSQAQVSDSTIEAYIRNSGTGYGLDAGQIIYLRQQGVSDVIINTMLTQPKGASSSYVSQPPQQMASVPAPSAPAPAVQADTVPASSSTVYIMPNTTTYPYPYYYDSYPYYYGGWYSPVSVSLGFGGRWGGGYYHGGYHGGYGGGWHGGGHGGGWHQAGTIKPTVIVFQ